MSRAHAYRLALPVAAALLIWSGIPQTARAQAAAKPAPVAPAQALPSPEQLEPAVDTTRSAPAADAAAPAASGAAATSATGGAQAAQGTTAAQPRSGAAARRADQGVKSQPGTSSGRVKADRIELDTTDITGNRELPKVLYIVPWKRSDLGELVGKPVNSLVDEVLQPLDRDVFQRQNRYYDALKPGQTGAAADAPQDSGAKP